jgi:hypothetical protein
VFVWGEAVAIIFVSASGIAGLAGLISAGRAGSRERRWTSREERRIDLRAAPEGGVPARDARLPRIAPSRHDVLRRS